MRLNAFLAKSGLCARRKAAQHIKDGRVKVNASVVLEPWYVVRENDTVSIDGKRLKTKDELYFIVNKPEGVASTVEDKFAPRKVVDLIPERYGRLYPVGRLDKDSGGLIILTNDGRFCYNLTHPKFEIEKEYEVALTGEADPGALVRAPRGGIQDKGEILKVKSCSAVSVKAGRMRLKVVLAEGKKRYIRRLFARLGFPVTGLKRIRIGGIRLGGLGEGCFKKMDKAQIYRLALGISLERS